MRVLGWICVGFFLYYVIDSGGPQQAIHNIAGELYWNTMPTHDIIETDDVQESIEEMIEKMRKEVDKIKN
jgi:hypothetical protein